MKEAAALRSKENDIFMDTQKDSSTVPYTKYEFELVFG